MVSARSGALWRGILSTLNTLLIYFVKLYPISNITAEKQWQVDLIIKTLLQLNYLTFWDILTVYQSQEKIRREMSNKFSGGGNLSIFLRGERERKYLIKITIIFSYNTQHSLKRVSYALMTAHTPSNITYVNCTDFWGFLSVSFLPL